jgi:predicted Zn-ribbon and HTH transcriptional regulator
VSIPPAALAAAHRARAIATIARTRTTTSTPDLDDAGRTALRKIADLLDAAANTLETEPAAVDNCGLHFPADAWLSLQTAEAVALAHPRIGIPRTLSKYVTAALYPHDSAESEVALPLSLLPRTTQAIVREAELFGRLLGLHGALRFVTDQATTTLVLEDVFRLHWQHALLASSIAADGARSDGGQTPVPAAVEIPTPATTAELRRAHDEFGPTLTYELKSASRFCFSPVHPQPSPAVRMVSHRGVTIPTCDEHCDAAAYTAQELYDALD